MTPAQWLSEGREKRQEALPSLEDIRKSLAFTMDEAEQLTRPGSKDDIIMMSQ